jgi:hypothetical protein
MGVAVVSKNQSAADAFQGFDFLAEIFRVLTRALLKAAEHFVFFGSGAKKIVAGAWYISLEFAFER